MAKIRELLLAAPALPLIRDELRAAPDAHAISLQKAAEVFPGAPHAEAALSGALLRLGCWNEAHNVAKGEVNFCARLRYYFARF